MEEITLWLNPETALQLVKLCSESDFDVNVLCGSQCFDGESIVSIMDLCGHTVTISPVTQDELEIEMFRKRVKEITRSNEV